MSLNDKMKIEIECNRGASDHLVPLLEQLQIMGGIGSSRKIQINDWDRKEDWWKNGFYRII